MRLDGAFADAHDCRDLCDREVAVVEERYGEPLLYRECGYRGDQVIVWSFGRSGDTGHTLTEPVRERRLTPT
jgi:hypothetical protein